MVFPVEPPPPPLPPSETNAPYILTQKEIQVRKEEQGAAAGERKTERKEKQTNKAQSARNLRGSFLAGQQAVD